MKRIVIVAPHFPPSNVTGVHRSRFLAAHLKKFGWEPCVLTVKPEYYEETPDPQLEKLLPKELSIIRTKAFGTKPVRLVGDISLRCFYWHWRELRKLAKKGPLDCVFISIFPAYSSLLGRLIYEEFKIPYVIDYQDPWVEYREVKRPLFSKAGLTHVLAKVLEPCAVGKASLLTAVAESYYEGVVRRNPGLAGVPKLVIPIGFDPSDHETAEHSEGGDGLFAARNGIFNLVYAGAILPESVPVWRALFSALKEFEAKEPALFATLKIHCIGTGRKPGQYTVRPIAEEYSLYEKSIVEHPARMPYLDVLKHLKNADATLVVGSTEKHYTASKIFDAVFAKRPILALLHSESSAVKYLTESRAALIVSFADISGLQTAGKQIESSLRMILNRKFDASRVDYGYFAPFTAEAQAQKLAVALNCLRGHSEPPGGLS